MAPLLKRIKSRMHIASYRKAIHSLEGQYLSVMRGRSMEFDDLREYQVGDDVKDIDWKSSARSHTYLVKRYIANRKQPVYFLVDTGLSMQGLTPQLETKKDIAIEVVGTLGYLCVKHNDTVALVHGDSTSSRWVKGKDSENHLESVLETINYSTNSATRRSNILNQIMFFNQLRRTRGIVVVVAGDFTYSDELAKELQVLKNRHQLLWVSVMDGNPLLPLSVGATISDVETGAEIPDFLRRDKKLYAEFLAEEEARKVNAHQFLRRQHVSHSSVTTVKEVVPTLLTMLKRRAREHRY